LALSTDQIPSTSTSTAAWELGVRLTITAPGRVTALRFYKLPEESGVHVGHLWDSQGRALATVTFTHETPMGWQEEPLGDTVPLAAGATVTVSVNHTVGSHFALTLNGLADGLTAGVLTAAASSGRSGVSGLPPTTPSSHSYWRDLVFQPTTMVDTGPVVSLWSPPPGRLVQSGDLIFQGAFKLPHGAVGTSSFDYGGTVLAFNPARGSLFVVGHPWQQHVAEIAIPAVSPSNTTLASLPMTTVIQPFVDATEGGLSKVGDGQVQVGGLLAYKGALYLSAFVYYDGSGIQQLSDYRTSPDFRVTGEVTGPFRVSSPASAGLLDGYFGLIPPAWQAALGGPVLHGQCCLSIISRTSFGPSAFVVDPAQLGVVTPQPATPLVYYPQAHATLGEWGTTSSMFNGSTQINGIVFPEGTRSVLFFGRHGTGPWCYGEGTADPANAGKRAPDGEPYCVDPTDNSKGGHAFPYVHQVWAYDAGDLAAVKRGERQPWEVKPYAVWPVPFPLSGGTHATGATYDPATGRIFIAQDFSDGDNPIVNVFTLKP
jgi:hypothetical protein